MTFPPRILLAAKLLLAACILACAKPALAADRRVYKIDSVIATLKKGTLTIQAKGAVQGGGWKNAHLRVVHGDRHSIMLEFIATPPPPGMAVIEGLVPVSATAEIRTRNRVETVHAAADANEITAQVLR
jgi:hypothetical protein